MSEGLKESRGARDGEELSSVPGIRSSAAHLPALDGLRGIAILLVMQSHFFGMTASHALGAGAPSTHAVDKAAAKVFSGGWAGVDLFFVLSGFLITGILVDAKGGGRYFRSFYARRVLRIFPLYYAFLFFVFFIAPHVGYVDAVAGIDEASRYQAWYWTYTYNFALVIDGALDGVPFLYGHLWSLAIEEQFYLFWPAVVLVLRRSALMWLCLAMIGAALALRFVLYEPPHPFADFAGLSFTLARSDSLALGALIALAWRDPADFARVVRSAPVVAAVATAALAIVVYRIGSFDAFYVSMQTIGITSLVLLFGALLVWVLQAPGGILARVCSTGALRFFGRYSYGLYVIHLLVAFRLVVSMEYLFTVPVVWGMELPAKLLFNLAATAACVAIAVVSWHLFESQILKLKRFFPYGAARDGHTPAPAGVAMHEAASAPLMTAQLRAQDEI